MAVLGSLSYGLVLTVMKLSVLTRISTKKLILCPGALSMVTAGKTNGLQNYLVINGLAKNYRRWRSLIDELIGSDLYCPKHNVHSSRKDIIWYHCTGKYVAEGLS